MASFLIKNVRIFDGKSTIDNGSVLVENGKISKVASYTIDFDGPSISKPGHTLLPGLIDVHIHADGGNEIALPQSLRFGVTTVCDMHNEWPNIQKLQKQRENGDCADLKTTSFAATIEGGWPAPIVLMHNDSDEIKAEIATWPKLKTPEDGRQYVRDRIEEGVDYIKLMHESGIVMGQNFPKPSLELQKAIIDEAHAHGLIAVAHAIGRQDTIEMLELGIDGLTHTFLDAPPTPELIELYKKSGSHCNPTLVAMCSGTTEGKPAQERIAHDPRVKALVGQTELDQMCLCMQFAKLKGATCQHAFETVRQLKKAGVPVLCGSDAARPAVGTGYGVSEHLELALLVNECGFTPAEALISATSLPAERFKFTDRGSIQEGLRADLLLVEGNPLENIDDTLNVRAVWTEGQICSSYKAVMESTV